MNIYGIPGTQVMQSYGHRANLSVLQLSAPIRQSPARAMEFLRNLAECNASVVFQGDGFVVVEQTPVGGFDIGKKP